MDICLKSKNKARIGDSILGDEWNKFDWKILEKSDDFKDNTFPGCDFRIKMKDFNIAVNVSITGREHLLSDGRTKSRCKIEFVGDGEPSIFTRGWIFHN